MQTTLGRRALGVNASGGKDHIFFFLRMELLTTNVCRVLAQVLAGIYDNCTMDSSLRGVHAKGLRWRTPRAVGVESQKVWTDLQPRTTRGRHGAQEGKQCSSNICSWLRASCCSSHTRGMSGPFSPCSCLVLFLAACRALAGGCRSSFCSVPGRFPCS